MLTNLHREFESSVGPGAGVTAGTVAQARVAADSLLEMGEAALAGEMLAGAELAAIVLSNEHGADVVSRLVGAAHDLTGADAMRIGLVALGDPLPLGAPLAEALRAHTTLLAGLSGSAAVAVWCLEPGKVPALAAHTGGKAAETTRRSASRILYGDALREPAVVIRAFGEPRAVLAWTPDPATDDATRALAARSAELLTLAFERAELLESTVADHAAQARAAERRLSRVGFDLHDGPLQNIALLRGELSALRGCLLDSDAGGCSTAGARPARRRDPLTTVEDLLAIAEAAEADLRALARSMESSELLKQPFDESLRSLVRTFSLRSGIEPAIQLHGDVAALTNMERVTLLRVIGEALANAREHSAATSVDISINVGCERVVAFVRDDGCGFDVDAVLSQCSERCSLGLLGMVDRLRLLGGTCKLDSRRGEGSAVTVAFDRYLPGDGAIRSEPGEPQPGELPFEVRSGLRAA